MDRKPPHEVYEVVKREGGRGVAARLFQIFLFQTEYFSSPIISYYAVAS